MIRSIRVPVRARDVRHGMERIAESLTAHGEPPTGPDGLGWTERVVPVCADLARPQLGLSPSTWATLRDEAHTIYHNGALVNYLLDYSGGGNNFDIAIRLLAFMLDQGITTTARNQVSLMPADVTANNIVAIANLPDTTGQTFHVTRDAYASLTDITELFSELTETEFTRYPVKEFVPLMIERCEPGDILFPLLNFFVHSADNITAMEFKRYDSSGYRAARDRSAFGIPDPPLRDVVLGIVRFMTRHGLVNGREADAVGMHHRAPKGRTCSAGR